MITIKRLTECSVQDAVTAWNEGFTGYFTDAQMTIDSFLNRLTQEGLSANYSIIAFDDKEPIGIVLNGIRNINGKKVSWNGGTGVAPQYRGTGVGKKMMAATLAIYEEEGVEIATLEAIKENEKAIHLYKKLGYEIEDNLLFIAHEGSFDSNPFEEHLATYNFIKTVPPAVQNLSFYKNMYCWQTQFKSVRDGEAFIAVDDHTGESIGYALFKRIFNDEGVHVTTVLYQCEAAPHRSDRQQINASLLSQLFAPFDQKIKRITVNLAATNQSVVSFLEEAGFEKSVEQVYMKKIMLEE
ncbi:GNAT family N-acetyltransferase [Bacillus sp. SCS-151]|uniref:GNAT family N-acetyltransferase n=1 Tax=Nanhaiella sioensis TaxID=3115293 RepID=UPI003978540F